MPWDPDPGYVSFWQERGWKKDGREIRAVLCGEAMNQRGQNIKNTFVHKDTPLLSDARLEIRSGRLFIF